MANNALGSPTMLQPGQMPMQGMNFQYSGPAGGQHPPGMTPPAMSPGGGGTGAPPQVPLGGAPGMVPGVPGSVGLNPGMGGPIHGQQQPMGSVFGGEGGGPANRGPFWGHGGFGLMGGMLNGLQLPADMSAQDFLSQLQGMNFRDTLHGYFGDVRDWRQGGMNGDRPTWGGYMSSLFTSPASAAPADPNNALAPAMPPATAPIATMPINPGTVGSSLGVNGASQGNQYGLPTYGG